MIIKWWNKSISARTWTCVKGPPSTSGRWISSFSVCTINCQVPRVASLFNDLNRGEVNHVLRRWSLHTEFVSWTPPHPHPTRVRISDSYQQEAKVPQTYTQRYNICEWESYDLSVELRLRSLSLATIFLQIARKMPPPVGPPTIPHNVQVEQKQGQATMIWAIGALVDLFYLKAYLKMK